MKMDQDVYVRSGDIMSMNNFDNGDLMNCAWRNNFLE